MPHRLIRFTYVAAVILALLLGLFAQPAQACGCGGYVSPDSEASITEERVLLRWDGSTEEILMSLGVLSNSGEAAVILPVPSQATVELGDSDIWDELTILTKPLIRHEKRYVFPNLLGGANEEGLMVGGAPPVTVLGRQTLGPFDVSNLAATDANALVDWLTENGYQLSPGLAEAFAPYVEQGWFYIAVRLQPESGEALTGVLDPLLVTFATDQLVYPMRGSANARDAETVNLYVLADHKVVKTQNFGSSYMSYADWVEPSAVHSDSALAKFIDRRLFLTKFEEQVYPEDVNDDFWFTFANQDEAYHEYITVYDDDYSLFYLSIAGLCLLLLSPFGLLGGFVIYRMRAGRKASVQ